MPINYERSPFRQKHPFIRKNVTPQMEKEIVDMYTLQMDTQEVIAQKHGVSISTVSRVLVRNKVQIRDRISTEVLHKLTKHKPKKSKKNCCIFCKTSLTKKDPAFVCRACQKKEHEKIGLI